MYNIIIVIGLLLAALGAQAQITGKVVVPFEESEGTSSADGSAVPGANIYWNASKAGTTSNIEGGFSLAFPASFPDTLVISFVGYKTVKIPFEDASKDPLNIKLSSTIEMNTFEIVARTSATLMSLKDVNLIQTITKKELRKAACCNISESFETNASVDLAVTDAVSGAKKIQMLGLDGVYSMIQFENMPFIRGLAGANGLSYVPGTWIESIQITKGTGSVVNGYETITGQINLEAIKPDQADPFFINLYVNERGRAEINTHVARSLNPKWSTMLYAHASGQQGHHDDNNDGFLDMPNKEQLNLFNRWKYFGDLFRTQFGVQGMTENSNGGQHHAEHHTHHGEMFTFASKVQQFGAWAKSGFLFPEKINKSVAVIGKFQMHKQSTLFGKTLYTGMNKFGYGNLIYQNGGPIHKYKIGASYLFDDYHETINDTLIARTESVPGAFGEYTRIGEKTSLVVGMRYDHHNMFGGFYSPRIHWKWNYKKEAALRLSVGKGYRMANAIVENLSAFASSREFSINEQLTPEEAYNGGISLQQEFKVRGKELLFVADFFHTLFVNKTVVDMEDPDRLDVYNLTGQAYSSSFQAELGYEFSERFNAKAAYKWYDIKTTYDGVLKSNPLIASNRVLLNADYSTKHEKWKFDVTMHWYGESRVPSTEGNAHYNTRGTVSDSYVTWNGQITKNFYKWTAYVGVENAFGYQQPNAIIDPHDPYGNQFDASLIWGPMMGRVIYLGMRFDIERKK